MTTSGVTTFNPACLEIIEEAYALIRVGAAEEPLTDFIAQQGRKTLNFMLKAWQADGLHLWTKEEGVLFLSSGQAEYGLGGAATDHSALASDAVTTALSADAAETDTSIDVDDITGIADGDNIGVVLDDGTLQWTTVNGTPSGSTVDLDDALDGDAAENNAVFAYTTKLVRPTRILQARRRIFNADAEQLTDIPVTILERPDYFDQPAKLQPATETMLYYSPQLVTGKLYLWLPASDLSDTVRFTFERPFETFEALTDTADVPAEWMETLAWNLAVRLAYKTSFPANERQAMEARAEIMKAKLLGFDKENASVNFTPDFTYGGGFGSFY